MPDRWFTLTADHLKAAGHGNFVDKGRTMAVGSIDPVEEAIENAVARVRRAIATGNVLDNNPAKIPGSFKGVAEKLALYALIERIGMQLRPDQAQALKDINSDLNRTADNKLKVEPPDDAPTEPQMQETGLKVSAVNVPCRQTGRDRTSGL